LGTWRCSILISSYYARRGGLSSLGDYSGISFVALYDKADAARWVFGAALSLKLIASYYALRADSADGDFRCGIYMIYMAVNGLNKGWGTGAALS
jgi:hypothetical protein